MTNYLIVDDEPQARKLLQTYMSGLTNYKLVKLCANAMEAYEALHASKIDLMFLDIKMPIVSGTDFLRSLKNPPLVIFTTAFNKYAMEGYELNVVDYLLKPIALPRLLNALEKVQTILNGQKASTIESVVDHLFIKVDHKLVKVNLDEILLIEGLQNYVKIHIKERILIANYTMKAIEGMISGQFIRVHRSFIVPLRTILAIDGNLIDTTYKQVPIGSSFKTAVMSSIHHKPD